MLTYEEALARLRTFEDADYRAFHKRLLKNDAINVIGVRMPCLRGLAKEWRGEMEALLSFPDEYYEITFLKCAVVGALPFDRFCALIDELVPLIDNWATCDCFNARCIGKNREAFLPYLRRYLADERVFVKRFALVTLLHHYVEKEYLPLIFESATACGAEEYYVTTAAAWLIAEVLVHAYDEGVAFLKEGGLPVSTHNLAIRKARESFRLTAEQKEELKALKR